MEDNTIDIIDLFKHLFLKKKRIFLFIVFGAFIGVIIAFSIPRVYTAKIKIATENNSKSNSQISGIASMMGLNMTKGEKNGITENIYPEIIASTPFINEFRYIQIPYKNKTISLEEYLLDNQKKVWWGYFLGLPSKLIKLFNSNVEPKNNAENPYSNLIPSFSQRKYEDLFSRSVGAVKDKKTGIYEFSVTMQDPLIAAIVADTLLLKLQIYMNNYLTSKSRQDLNSNLNLLDLAKADYYLKDSLYAIYFDRNQSIISQLANIKLERLKNERNIAFSVYQQVANQVEMSKIKLQEETPFFTTIEPSRIPNYPSAPNKKIIVLGFMFLGGFMIIIIEILRYLFKY